VPILRGTAGRAFAVALAGIAAFALAFAIARSGEDGGAEAPRASLEPVSVEGRTVRLPAPPRPGTVPSLRPAESTPEGEGGGGGGGQPSVTPTATPIPTATAVPTATATPDDGGSTGGSTGDPGSTGGGTGD